MAAGFKKWVKAFDNNIDLDFNEKNAKAGEDYY
jgi:hypothetical protein